MRDGALEGLRSDTRGQVLDPHSRGYDAARAVWNAMIDRHPTIIARCAGMADVIRCVRFAREHGLDIAVRGGGHNVAGTSVCDGGLMIDLSAMRSAHVDPATRTVRIEGGATLADLDRETQAFGLATPGGVVSTTGVGGLALGGGFGWLSRQHGLAADNLIAVDLVTADGTAVTASDDLHPDLFWAVRGGGGNFGIATSLVFKLHEVGPEILFGPTFFLLDDARRVLRAWRDFAVDAPRQCCVWADLLTAPQLPFLPERYHGAKVVSLMQAFIGDLDEGERVLAGLRKMGGAIADAVGPLPYTVAQSLLDGAYAKGARNYWHSHSYEVLSDTVLDDIVDMAGALPSAQSDILICHLGGAINDPGPDATAYPHRTTSFVVTPGARWFDPSDDERCLAWLHEWSGPLGRSATGGRYVNFIAEREGGERSAYASNLDRLRQIKGRFDPGNVFRMNQNVAPAA